MHQAVLLIAAVYLLAGILFLLKGWRFIQPLRSDKFVVVFLWRLLVRPAHWLVSRSRLYLLHRVARWLEAPVHRAMRSK